MGMVKTLTSIPKELLAELDLVVQEEKRSRSDVLREAIRFYLQARWTNRQPGRSPLVQRAVAIQDALAQKDTVPWDGVAEIRRWREGR
jgi:metal-responsive CopG/Arc/MetJ family transcriptional regulator